MAIRVGGIDIARQSLENEFLTGLIDEYLEWIIKENKLKEPTEDQIKKMSEKVLKNLQKKYPDAGIDFIKE